jgi:beta-lactamase superfamily II metal-dependent hydrolase
MRRTSRLLLLATLASLMALPLVWAKATKALQIYFIDVEGGQSTLIVSPLGGSILIDSGWPDENGRDANRIMAAAKAAGVARLDYVLITHFHRDHVGGVPQLADRIRIGTFIDHGTLQEDSPVTNEDFAAYQKVLPRAKHIVAKPGDSIPLAGVGIRVLTSATQHIAAALPGGGQPNPYCASEPEAPADPTENQQSVGVLVTFGQFRFIDLGDLTKRREIELACPNNLVGPVDLYLTTHHGWEQSNTRAIVDALHPRVAIMNNGATKGGSPSVWQIVHDSPGLQDLWQLHYSEEGGPDHNVAEQLIANPHGPDLGKYIQVIALANGTFTVQNSRNGVTKTYTK